MTTCDLLSSCNFINSKMATMPATAKLLKGSYCTRNPSECARHKAAHVVGTKMIPDDLAPSDDEIAEMLMAVYESHVTT